MHDTSAPQDVSESMGIEDYTLGRPNRAQSAPTPWLYSEGWDFATAEDARAKGERP